MEFFNQTYIALRGPTGAPQTAVDTIRRLADRLTQSTQISDRRAAVLSLKGLAREYKEDVGQFALAPLLHVLENDAKLDEDIGKAVLETLTILCEADGDIPAGHNLKHERELTLQHSDALLGTPSALDALFALLSEPTFYSRLGALKLLSVVLQHRKSVVQDRIIQTRAIDSILSVLDERNDMIRNEALSVLQALIVSHFELQKVLAFGGVFEKLLSIVQSEQGLDGGVLVQDCLSCIDGIIRFNAPAQSYFREISMLGRILPLLLFPPVITPNDGTPQEFSLQFWDDQKTANAALVVGILSLLVSATASNLKPLERYTILRCLSEMALSSNAPTPLKTQSIRSLTLSNTSTNASTIPPELAVNPLLNFLTPYIPVPETNGEEWDRLDPVRGIDSLVTIILEGEYNGTQGAGAGPLSFQGMELRGTSLAVFDEFVHDEAARTSILTAMGSAKEPPTSASALLMSAISTLPPDPLPQLTSKRIHLSTLLLSSLLRAPHLSQTSPKAIARGLMATPVPQSSAEAAFFVPADTSNSAPRVAPPVPEDEDPPSTLLQLLTEHLSLASLARTHASSLAIATYGSEAQPPSEWDRVIIGYLVLLSTWLWEDPPSVRVFLEGGGVGVLVDLVNQDTGVDSLVQGLCSFLLGVCYEFNREPGEITRATLHPIINRLGADTLVSRMTRVREDSRFKAVTPESTVVPSISVPHGEVDLEGGDIWLDWGFVEFWKTNYYTIQRGISRGPDFVSPSTADSPEMATIVASLRDVVRKQAQEYDKLRAEMNELVQDHEVERTSLHGQISSLSQELESLKEQKKEGEKEQEDLLVLLEETTTKRRRDKERMREAGLEVSEDEGGDEDEDEEE